jgi:hypothetical protein
MNWNYSLLSFKGAIDLGVDVVIVEMVDIGVLEKVIRVNTVGGY